MVLWDSAPTPGSLRLASALPTSAWVTPSLIRRCLNRSAKASEHSVILSYIGRMFMFKWVEIQFVNITVQCLALWGPCQRHSEASGGREGGGGGGAPGGGGTSCPRGTGTSRPWPGAGWGGGSSRSPASSSATPPSSLRTKIMSRNNGKNGKSSPEDTTALPSMSRLISCSI